MTASRAQVATTVVLAVALVATPVVWTPLAFANGESRSAVLTTWLVVPALPLVGAWVARRVPTNPLGWLLLAVGSLQTLGMLHGQVLARAVATGWSDAAIAWLVWTSNLLFLPSWPLFALVLLLFPDGRPPSPRWRPVAWLAVGGTGLGLLGLLAPGPMPGAEVAVDNPVGIGGLGVLAGVGVGGLGLLVVAIIGAVASVVVRWRAAVGIQRLQLRWVAFAAVVALVVSLASLPLPPGSALEVLGLLLLLGGVPVAVGIAVVRHRLYDLPVVVNRTVVYALATAALLATYTLVTAATVQLLKWDDAASALIATAVVAVSFSPVRDRAQRLVDQWLFGARHDPYQTMLELGRELSLPVSPMDVPQVVVDRVRAALRVPYVGLVPGAGTVVPTHRAGALAPDAATVVVPLEHRGELVGRLVVGLRAPDTDLAASDRRVLEGMAAQAGAVVQAARLQGKVQRSTARRVAAVEEERRRIRRDLHDGLGPTLAALALGLETAGRRAVRSGDTAAADLLWRLHDETRAAVASIRELVYGLRPPALDEVGLEGALRRAFEGHETAMAVDLWVSGISAAAPLPAAVEVAAYRIAVEAVANAARHAAATSCTVEVACAGALRVAVSDDGTGLGEGWQAGVGITSMRERAAELGGTLEITTDPAGGTRIVATLPVGAPAEDAEVARG